jgi:hypothetical protein
MSSGATLSGNVEITSGGNNSAPPPAKVMNTTTATTPSLTQSCTHRVTLCETYVLFRKLLPVTESTYC